jgi:hypothetical protein
MPSLREQRALLGLPRCVRAEDRDLLSHACLLAHEFDRNRRRAPALGIEIIDDVENHGFLMLFV